MTLSVAGERLLGSAADLFYRRGIRAVGVDLIAETAGTTKKTLYDQFGSKDALVALYLERRMLRWQSFVTDWLAAHEPDPGPERVLAVFDALEAWTTEQDRGCAFVNAYAELGGTDHPGLAVIRAEKTWLRDLYVRLCEEAGLADPAGTGRAVHLVYEGAIVTSTAGGEEDAVRRAREVAARLLGPGPAPRLE